jgi:hypothetical protein
VIQGFPTGIGIVFFRIVAPTAHDRMDRAVGVHHHLPHLLQIDLRPQLTGQIDEGLGMVDRRVRFGKRLQDRPERVARFR